MPKVARRAVLSRKAKVTGRKPTTKSQGREMKVVLQAPTLVSLNRMIARQRSYAKTRKMKFKVLKKGKDPDGGYEAIVVAHNANPDKVVNEVMWEDVNRSSKYIV